MLSQGIHISNHHNIHFKYLRILFVNYTSLKLEKKLLRRTNAFLSWDYITCMAL